MAAERGREWDTPREAIQERVSTWRANRYPCANYPAIGEILDYARLPESEDLRFLRRPQLRALETYWYIRLIEETPKIPDLYSRYFEEPIEHLGALGIKVNDERVINLLLKGGVEGFFKRVATDDAFVKELRLESLRETLIRRALGWKFVAGWTSFSGGVHSAMTCSRDTFLRSAAAKESGLPQAFNGRESSALP